MRDPGVVVASVSRMPGLQDPAGLTDKANLVYQQAANPATPDILAPKISCMLSRISGGDVEESNSRSNE